MYINILKNVVLKSEDIIGIFNVNEKSQKNNNQLLEKLIENKCIDDYSGGNKKSLILYIKNSRERGIFSNISSSSLGKRKEIIN